MSNIEWTGESLNPIVGCSIKSPGCKKCYAMPMAARLEAMGVPQYRGLTEPSKTGPVWTGKLAFHPAALDRALKRKKAQTYFVNSMGDLFHEDCPDEWIDRVFAVMALCPQHTFQVLTKRSDRMREYIKAKTELHDQRPYDLDCHLGGHGDTLLPSDGDSRIDMATWPLPNVWLGVSVEDQAGANERIPDLLATPAAVRWISAEPLLGAVDLERVYETSSTYFNATSTKLGLSFNGEKLDWIVVGGESGKGARSFDPAWARSLRDQCAEADVPFFMKQMGGAVKSKLPPIPEDLMIRQFPNQMEAV